MSSRDSKQLLVFCGLIALLQACILAEEHKPGDVRESGTIAMKLCYCPSGKFLMGSLQGTNAISRGDGSDKRQWEVTLSQGFWMGQTEVTQKQWSDIMKSEPWKDPGGNRPLGPVGDDIAADVVSYFDAEAFCEALTKQEHKSGKLSNKEAYRLPTEAEWEYACRAGTKTEYSFGDSPDKLADHAWFIDNSNKHVQSVAKKLPNPWGLYDMHGNVYEWCLDWYSDLPAGGGDPQGPAASDYRSKVFRGGTVKNDPMGCRSAIRYRAQPAGKGQTIGFRVVLGPIKQKP